jgi:hypothetical protein
VELLVVARLALLVAVASVAVVAATGGTAAAAVVLCKTKVYPGAPVYVTSARGISCAAAAKEQRKVRWTGRNRFTTPAGYVCAPSGRGKVGYQIRCELDSETHDPWVYRIEFAD